MHDMCVCMLVLASNLVVFADTFKSNVTEHFLVFTDTLNLNYTGHFHLLLSEDCTISSLSLRSNKINCTDIAPFAAALSTNKSLTNLSLHNNSIEDEGAQQIAKVYRFYIVIISTFLNLRVPRLFCFELLIQIIQIE
jgi:hypothetical protein